MSTTDVLFLKSEFKSGSDNFIQLFLQLFIDGQEYHYYGLDTFMCIWIITHSLLQEYQKLIIRNPKRTQDQLLSHSIMRNLFENAVIQYSAHVACSKVQLASNLTQLLRILLKVNILLCTLKYNCYKMIYFRQAIKSSLVKKDSRIL